MENNQILIQSVITVTSILLTAFLAYYFSQKRYTYEKIFDRKLAYLEEIYGKIISLEKDLKKYIFTTGADKGKEFLSKKMEEISSIQAKFFELQEYFWEKEIILNKSSISILQSFISISIEILSKLQTSIISQHLNDPKNSSEQLDSAFQIMNGKLAKVKDQLRKDFREVIKI